MAQVPENIYIYHITDIENLPDIIKSGELISDALMPPDRYENIGYKHIKERRLKELQVDCCSGRYVGEFVPFYFCPRSAMLYTINIGCTGRPVGCQKTIVHLVSTLEFGVNNGKIWAFSDGNGGSYSANFYSDLSKLNSLDWDAIKAVNWKGRSHQKAAEFLVFERFPWTGFESIGCHNETVKNQVASMLLKTAHKPIVTVKNGWYY